MVLQLIGDLAHRQARALAQLGIAALAEDDFAPSPAASSRLC